MCSYIAHREYSFKPFLIGVSVLHPPAIEIGFTRERVEHTESPANSSAIIRKSRPSEQTFQIEVQITTPQILGLGLPATRGDDFQISNVLPVTLTPDDDQVEITYQIVGDEIPERTEIFLISMFCDFPNSPTFDCDVLQECFSELQVSIIDDDGESFQQHLCIFPQSIIIVWDLVH